MILYSLTQEKNTLVPLEIELAFIPGLPQIHFLGLPDQIIKESIFRIKSAIRASGYELPKTHQIIVNLRPLQLRKSSLGLELAVAIGILSQLEQIQLPQEILSSCIYGELTLDGKVHTPNDLLESKNRSDLPNSILTGPLRESDVEFIFWTLAHLKDIPQGPYKGTRPSPSFKRPLQTLQHWHTEQELRLILLSSLGRHHTFLAGPMGVGKTTLAKAIWGAAPAPSEMEQKEIIKQSPQSKEEDPLWRPFISPHHTLTTGGLVGGGHSLEGGEVLRAHNGVLLLDEYLEFQPHIQELLREPMENGTLRISRAGHFKVFQTQFQAIATTNLCPCGLWSPGRNIYCKRTLSKCKSYREKISGPVLDRFQIFKVLESNRKQSNKEWLGTEVLNKINAAMEAQKSFPKPSSQWTAEELHQWEPKEKKASHYYLDQLPHRRSLQIKRVAHTIAMLEGQTEIRSEFVEEALHWGHEDMEKLNQNF